MVAWLLVQFVASALAILAAPPCLANAPSLANSGRELAAPGQTAWVTQAGGPCASPTGSCVTFAEALTDPSVSQIYLVADVSLSGEDFKQYSAAPYIIDRDVTISSQPGGPWRDLDFNFLPVRLMIGKNVTVTFRNMGMSDPRMASGATVDIFTGDEGSAMIVKDVDRRRAVALAPDDSIAIATSYPRPPRFPGNQSLVLLSKGCSAPGEADFLFADFAVHWGGAAADTVAYSRGYDLHMVNVTRSCDEIVPSSCQAKMGRDQCLTLYTDMHLKAREKGGGGGSGSIVAAAAGGAAAGAVLLGVVAAGAAWFAIRRRRLGKGGACVGTNGAMRCGPVEGMLSPSQGWRLVHFVPSPEYAGTTSSKDPIEIGALLGRGSFGTVYQGVWQGAPVAVKIIQHAVRDASAAVLNEARLALSFDHPNILKAHHVVQWKNQASLDQNTAPSLGGGSGQGAQGKSSSSSSAKSQQRQRPQQQQQREWVVRLGTTSSGAPLTDSAQGGALCLSGPTLQSMLQQEQDGGASGGASGGAGGGRASGGGNSGGGVSGTRGTDGQLVGRWQLWKPPHHHQQQPQQQQQQSGPLPLFGRGRPQGGREQPARAAAAAGAAAAAATGGTLETEDSCWAEQSAETWLITEFCDRGDLERAASTGMLRRQDGTPDEALILSLLHDVASGLAYIHSQNVLHADLKAENILLSSRPPSAAGVVAKVSDFGLSRALGAGQTHQSTRTVGTVTHMPPELLIAGKLSQRTDVYGFGILMSEVWRGEHSFPGMTFAEVFAQVVVHQARPPVPPDMPEALSRLMTSCWDHEPSNRPDMSQVLTALEARMAEAGARAPGGGEGDERV